MHGDKDEIGKWFGRNKACGARTDYPVMTCSWETRLQTILLHCTKMH